MTVVTVCSIHVRRQVAGAIGLWYFHSDDPTYDYPSSPAMQVPAWPAAPHNRTRTRSLGPEAELLKGPRGEHLEWSTSTAAAWSAWLLR